MNAGLTRAASRHGALRLSLAAVLFLLTGSIAREASAQDTTFNLDRLRLGGAPDDGIGVWRPEIAERARLYGQIAAALSWNPFRIEHHLEDEQERRQMASVSGAPVREQFTTYMDIGFEVFKRFSLQVMFPLTLAQTGNPTNAVGVTNARDAVNISTVAPGDMRFEARGAIFRTDDGFYKLGANLGINAPSGNEESFTGDKDASGIVGLANELDWKFLILTLNTGFNLRPTASVNQFFVGHEFTYGLGGFLPFREGRIRIGLEVFGSVMMTGEDAAAVETTPIEWAVEGRFTLDQKKQLWLNGFGGTRLAPGYAPDFRTGIAFGGWFNIVDPDPPSPKKEPRFDKVNDNVDTDKDGYPDSMDLCPTIPEDNKPPFATDGCPAEADRDKDGIPDSRDKCPDEPEDFDKVDDKDGCPEDDADQDGIPDAKDACPKEPGEPSPEKDKNGCPKYIRRIEGSTEIQILKKVEFDTGRATLRSDSFPILDEVYRLLVANPEIKLLSIEGHTDDVGTNEANLILSRNRAKTCLDYLVKKGIDAKRLTSDGFGEEKPLPDAPNTTVEGRAKNRRTEFHIKDQAIPGVEEAK